MLDLLELEETVGRAWHRIVGTTASYPLHADQAVSLAEVQGQIAVMFRALGGEAGVQIASSTARKSGHRLGWRQRIGLGDERSANTICSTSRSVRGNGRRGRAIAVAAASLA